MANERHLLVFYSPLSIPKVFLTQAFRFDSIAEPVAAGVERLGDSTGFAGVIPARQDEGHPGQPGDVVKTRS